MKKKILIVDDVEDFVDLLKVKLQSWDYDVVTAFDGLKGLEQARKELPDLILLDIMMPKMNGFDMLQELKKDIHVQDIHVVMVSAKNDPETLNRAKMLGASDYIWKPELREKLQFVITTLLGQGRVLN